MKNVYIAGKVTGQNRLDCLMKFQAAENRVRRMGYNPINPMKLVPDGTSWKLAMKICLRALLTCDFIYALDDWYESKGAQLEIMVAHHVGIEQLKTKDNGIQQG